MTLKSQNPTARPLILCGALLAAFAFAGEAHAQYFLTEHLTGSFPADTTLGGVALGHDTAFTLTATFNADPALDIGDNAAHTIFPGTGVFATASLSLTLAGFGTFTGIPGSEAVFLADPRAFGAPDGVTPYAIGIINRYTPGGPDAGLFAPVAYSVTLDLNADAPSPTVFDLSNPVDWTGDGVATRIALVGVTGGLVVPADASVLGMPTSASLTAVPEPTETAVVIGLGLGAFALVRRGRRTALVVK